MHNEPFSPFCMVTAAVTVDAMCSATCATLLVAVEMVINRASDAVDGIRCNRTVGLSRARSGLDVSQTLCDDNCVLSQSKSNRFGWSMWIAYIDALEGTGHSSTATNRQLTTTDIANMSY